MNAPATEGIWTRLAAPLPAGTTSWRQDGKSFVRDGKPLARFVAFVDAGVVREHLDRVVPGEWNLTLEMLSGAHDEEGVVVFAFKARLQIQAVVREDVGVGRDLKSASSDAFKRASARFGVAHSLREQFVFVQLDGEGKGAKPLENPQLAWDRKHRPSAKPTAARPAAPPARATAPAAAARPATPQQIDPRIPRGAPAPSRPPEPPPVDDDDGCPF